MSATSRTMAARRALGNSSTIQTFSQVSARSTWWAKPASGTLAAIVIEIPNKTSWVDRIR